jgi:hypothetical protein
VEQKIQKSVQKLILQEKEVPDNIKAVNDVWSGSKYGKRYWQNIPQKYMRK